MFIWTGRVMFAIMLAANVMLLMALVTASVDGLGLIAP